MNISLRIKTMKKLIEKQNEYIKLLTDWDTSITSFLASHRMTAPLELVTKAESMRIEIAKLKLML